LPHFQRICTEMFTRVRAQELELLYKNASVFSLNTV